MRADRRRRPLQRASWPSTQSSTYDSSRIATAPIERAPRRAEREHRRAGGEHHQRQQRDLVRRDARRARAARAARPRAAARRAGSRGCRAASASAGKRRRLSDIGVSDGRRLESSISARAADELVDAQQREAEQEAHADVGPDRRLARRGPRGGRCGSGARVGFVLSALSLLSSFSAGPSWARRTRRLEAEVGGAARHPWRAPGRARPTPRPNLRARARRPCARPSSRCDRCGPCRSRRRRPRRARRARRARAATGAACRAS